MSTRQASATKHISSAFGTRTPGPFGDAANRLNASWVALSEGKPVSRRVARQRTKRIGGKAPNSIKSKVDIVVHPELSVPTSAPSKSVAAPATPKAVAPPITYPSQPYAHTTPSASTPARLVPIHIIRTLPPPPAKKFHGPFEACSRAEVFVEEVRTFEEDAWGVIYGPYDVAATVAGPIRVTTLQAPPGSAGSVKFFYG
ncbi:hypothetical protein C8R46DRAFT_1027502 [Mycena filopes]|nr:hypothetical protein C8R46DRAFT_1027502 [Mycena filopes]